MVIGYWIVAGLLGLLYLYSGAKKVAQSQEQLAPMMGWVGSIPMPVVRLIGVVEILGVAGLILPPLRRSGPRLRRSATVILTWRPSKISARSSPGSATGPAQCSESPSMKKIRCWPSRLPRSRSRPRARTTLTARLRSSTSGSARDDGELGWHARCWSC